MNNDSADAAYWYKKYIETSQKAQEYAAKVVEVMTRLETQMDSQESAYQRGYLDGMAKRPQPLTDEQINRIAKNYALNNPTTPLHFARAIEAAHGIKESA